MGKSWEEMSADEKEQFVENQKEEKRERLVREERSKLAQEKGAYYCERYGHDWGDEWHGWCKCRRCGKTEQDRSWM